MTLSDKIQSLTYQELATNFDLVRSVKYRKELLEPKYRALGDLFSCDCLYHQYFSNQRTEIREELSREIIKRYKQIIK